MDKNYRMNINTFVYVFIFYGITLVSYLIMWWNLWLEHPKILRDLDTVFNVIQVSWVWILNTWSAVGFFLVPRKIHTKLHKRKLFWVFWSLRQNHFIVRNTLGKSNTLKLNHDTDWCQGRKVLEHRFGLSLSEKELHFVPSQKYPWILPY
jgi:hypothetical protein